MSVKYLEDGTIIIENSCETFVFPVAAVEILKLPEYIVKDFLAKKDFVVKPSSLSTQSDDKLSEPCPTPASRSRSRSGPSVKTRKNKKMFKEKITLPSIPKESPPPKEDFVVKPLSLSKPSPASRSRSGPSIKTRKNKKFDLLGIISIDLDKEDEDLKTTSEGNPVPSSSSTEKYKSLPTDFFIDKLSTPPPTSRSRPGPSDQLPSLNTSPKPSPTPASKSLPPKEDFVVKPSSLSAQSDDKLSKPSTPASRSRPGPPIKTRKNKKLFEQEIALPDLAQLKEKEKRGRGRPRKSNAAVTPSNPKKLCRESGDTLSGDKTTPIVSPQQILLPKVSTPLPPPPKEDYVVVKPSSSSSSSTRQSDKKFSKAPASCRYNRVIQFQDANKLKKPFKIPRKVTVEEPEPEPVPAVCVQDEDANDGINSIHLDKEDEGLKTTSEGNPVPASSSTETYKSLPADFSNFFIDDPHALEFMESQIGYPDPKQNDRPSCSMSLDVQQQDIMEVDKAGLLDEAIAQFLDDMEKLGPQNKGDQMDSTPTPPSIDESPDVFDAVNPELGDSSEEESEEESEEPSTEVSEVSSSPKAAAARNLSDEDDQDVLQLCVDDDEFAF